MFNFIKNLNAYQKFYIVFAVLFFMYTVMDFYNKNYSSANINLLMSLLNITWYGDQTQKKQIKELEEENKKLKSSIK